MLREQMRELEVGSLVRGRRPYLPRRTRNLQALFAAVIAAMIYFEVVGATAVIHGEDTSRTEPKHCR